MPHLTITALVVITLTSALARCPALATAASESSPTATRIEPVATLTVASPLGTGSADDSIDGTGSSPDSARPSDSSLGVAPPAPPLSEYAEESIAGFRVLFHPSLMRDSFDADRRGRVRAALIYDLETVARVIPSPALSAVREIPIVITHEARESPGFSPRGACFHPSADWLTSHGLDAAREGVVEILSVDDYMLWRAEQPAMLLHELAHAYHWLLGFGREDVREAFKAASAAGALYREVAHVMRPGGAKQKAYALTNEHEYFAELSEARFLRNDIFPFIADELRAYDPAGYAVVDRLWHLSGEEIAAQRAGGVRPVSTPPSRGNSSP
jgi:hypothetical protein